MYSTIVTELYILYYMYHIFYARMCHEKCSRAFVLGIRSFFSAERDIKTSNALSHKNVSHTVYARARCCWLAVWFFCCLWPKGGERVSVIGVRGADRCDKHMHTHTHTRCITHAQHVCTTYYNTYTTYSYGTCVPMRGIFMRSQVAVVLMVRWWWCFGALETTCVAAAARPIIMLFVARERVRSPARSVLVLVSSSRTRHGAPCRLIRCLWR